MPGETLDLIPRQTGAHGNRIAKDESRLNDFTTSGLAKIRSAQEVAALLLRRLCAGTTEKESWLHHLKSFLIA